MIDNVDVSTLLGQGKTAFQKEKYEQAYKLLVQASDIEPENQEVLYQLALCNNSLGNLDEAVECMEKVDNPPGDLFIFWSTNAHSYKTNREYHKSINSFKRALLCNPDDVNRKIIKSNINNLVLKAEYPPPKN